jgi:hypothetical protein
MTLPEESDRAVAATREFLVRLSSPYVENGIKGVRREVRAEASRLLRHYPYSWNGDFPDADNVANQDTLTDDERKAVTTAMNAYAEDNADEECARIEATLWGLLERLG